MLLLLGAIANLATTKWGEIDGVGEYALWLAIGVLLGATSTSSGWTVRTTSVVFIVARSNTRIDEAAGGPSPSGYSYLVNARRVPSGEKQESPTRGSRRRTRSAFPGRLRRSSSSTAHHRCPTRTRRWFHQQTSPDACSTEHPYRVGRRARRRARGGTSRRVAQRAAAPRSMSLLSRPWWHSPGVGGGGDRGMEVIGADGVGQTDIVEALA